MSDEAEVLVIADDDIRLGCLEALALAGVRAIGLRSAEEMRSVLPRNRCLVVLSDVRLPGMDGTILLRQLMEQDPDLPVILMTGHGDVRTAVQAMKDGAYDFVQIPFQSCELVSVVRKALDKRRLTLQVRHLRRKGAVIGGLESRIIGRSPAITELRAVVQDVAAMPTDVILLGETGAGKELIARCLHDLSGRKGPFVALNCGGLPETLFESEIFGHEAGSFSGAARRRIGKIEHAHGGTLFLDEIESMPMAMQVKLLRVLQERVVERLGSNQLIPVDFRVIAATKVDLLALSEEGEFRADLHFRLSVATIDLPPLRSRREDIPLLFDTFVNQAAVRLNRAAPPVKDAVIRELLAHNWPGNVRELRNQAERYVLGLKTARGGVVADEGEGPVALATAVEAFERSLIVEALRRNNGSLSRTAEAMQIPKTTLFGKIRRYNIPIEN